MNHGPSIRPFRTSHFMRHYILDYHGAIWPPRFVRWIGSLRYHVGVHKGITQDIYKKRGKGFFFVLLANSLFLPLPDVGF